MKIFGKTKSGAASLCAVSAIALTACPVALEPAAARAFGGGSVKGLAGVTVYDCRTTGTRVGKKQEVTVHISNISPRDSNEFFALDARLDRAIRLAHVGQYDGNGIGLDGSGADYFAFGPSAVLLWRTMRPIIASASPARGSYIVMTLGDEAAAKVKTTRCKLRVSS